MLPDPIRCLASYDFWHTVTTFWSKASLAKGQRELGFGVRLVVSWVGRWLSLSFPKLPMTSCFVCFLLVIWMDLLKSALCWKHLQPKNRTKKSGIALFYGVILYIPYVHIHTHICWYLFVYISPFIGKMCVFPSSTICMCIYTYHHPGN